MHRQRIVLGIGWCIGGAARRVGPGDAVILQEGFTGTWEVVETTLKDYVVKT